VAAIDPVTGIALTRNPHWSAASDPIRTALPDRIEVRTGLTQLQRDQELLVGSADVDITSAGVDKQTEDRIRVNPDLAARADNPATGVVRMLALPTTSARFQTVRCRKAIALTIDRAAAVSAMGGAKHARPATGLWPSTMTQVPTSSGQVGAPAPDLVGAQRELSGCRTLEDHALTMAVPNTPAWLAIAQAVRTALANLGTIGVDVKITGLDPGTYYSVAVGSAKAITSAGYDLIGVAWSADFPAPSSYLPPLARSATVSGAASTNYAVLSSSALDGQLSAAISARDAGKAAAAWGTAATTVADTWAYLPLLEEKVLLLSGQRLRNVSVSPVYRGYDLAIVGVRG
jgi:peptide/nickel transport system substrate-binding protein